MKKLVLKRILKVFLLIFTIPFAWFVILNFMHFNSSQKFFHDPFAPSNKTLFIKQFSTSTPPLVFQIYPIAVIYHVAGVTDKRYESPNGHDEINDCKEVFVVFTGFQSEKCFLGYKYEYQYYMMEITGAEQRYIFQKLISDGFFELTNLLDRTEMYVYRQGYRYIDVKNTNLDYS